ncbi:MAG: hypothetical protein ACYC2G_17395, partial [Gemmatimonadaceae bacterium]
MIDRVQREGEALLEAVAREEYEAYSGLKPAPALQLAYERHAAAYGDDALEAVREALLGATAGTDEWRAARALFEWVVGTRSSRALAGHDEREIAWEARAVARTSDGRDIPYQRLSIEISNTVDRAERLRLESGRG